MLALSATEPQPGSYNQALSVEAALHPAATNRIGKERSIGYSTRGKRSAITSKD